MNIRSFIRKILVLAQFCGLFVTVSVTAVEIPDPYLAVVPVLDQSQKERVRAIKQGLSTVLVRISGKNQAADNVQIRFALKDPDNYISEFGYSTLDRTMGNDASKYRQIAKIRYDAYLVNQLLKGVNLPVWGSNRPDLLMWIAIEDEGVQQVLSATEALPAREVLKAEADRRGVPLIFPLMDIEDVNNLSYNELWYLFRDKLETASSRYSPEAVLAGKLYRRTDTTWSSRWLFLFDNTAYGFAIQSDEKVQGAVQALGVAADHLAEHYAVSSGENHGITVEIEVLSVDNIKHYAQTLHYLEEIATIRQVSLVRVEKNRLVFNVTADGNLKKLQEIIALDSKLVRVHLLAEIAEPKRLIYRWQAL